MARTVNEGAVLFTKERLLASKRYADKRDILNVLLEDGRSYTVGQANTLIEKFMKREVK